MKYSVGEVSKLLGITPNALRFYEREGILTIRREENGRRYYDQQDITRLLSCKKYSAMGIPLKVIARQFSPTGDRRHVIADRVAACEQAARQKAAYYQNLADDIAAHAAVSAQLEERYGEIRIETSPACLILFDDENQLMTRDNRLHKLMRQWIAAMPAVKLSCVCLSSDLEGGEATLAYSIHREAALRAGLDPQAPGVLSAPAKPSLHLMFSHYDIFTEPRGAFSAVFAYMREKGLSLDGTPWAQLVVVEVDGVDSFHCFMDVWVPFRL